MFTRVTRYLSAAVCAMGLFVTASADADDHGEWEHRRDSHHRYDDRGRHRGHDYDRHEWSRRDYPQREYRSYRNDWRWDGRYRGGARPYWNYRCDDHRHYGYSHFHVPVRYYRSDAYSRYPYRGVYRDRGAEATVILSFPL